MLYFLVTAPGPLTAVLQELISGDGEDYPKMQDTWVGFYRTIKLFIAFSTPCSS